MISFFCPECGKNLRVKDELAGKRGKCPECGGPVQIPAAVAAGKAVASGSRAADSEGKTLAPRMKPASRDQTEEATLSPSDSPADTAAWPGGPNRPSTAPRELTEFLAPAQEPDELGRLGLYRVLEVLGQGGMGVVYKAEDPKLKRRVALKAMLPGLGANEAARKRFLREAQAAAAIEHDNIVHIYQVDEDRGIPFMAMQFLKGESLDGRLKREGRLPVVEVLRIGREAARGLAAAHQRGLIHRDIKPAKLWLEGDERRVKILDFGLARAVGDTTHLTQTGAIVGTPAYMAPEQAAGRPVDHRCDLFSLGCVLYRMCTGKLPFKGNDTLAIISALALETPESPSALHDDVPQALSDLIMKLLAKKPVERPGSAKEVADALQALAEDKTLEKAARTKQKAKSLPAKPTAAKGAKEKTQKILARSGKRPTWLWPAIGGGAVALLLLGVFLLRVQTDRGTLVIEVNDPGVEVVVKMNDVMLVDRTTKREFSLKAGDGVVLVYEKDGIGPLVTKKFTLNKGGKATVSVAAEVTAARTNPDKGKDKGKADNGLISLFNGKDLAGWEKVGNAEWSVEDGVLKVVPGQARGWLASDRDYADFELELEYRLGTKTNSGVFLRAWKDGAINGGQFMEIQLIDDQAYGTIGQPTGTAAIFDILAAKPAVQSRPSTWHKLGITLQGRHTQVRFDGQKVIDANLDDYPQAFQRFPGLTKTTGRIGLQNYGSPIEFRNIRVRELNKQSKNPATTSIARDVPRHKQFLALAAKGGIDVLFLGDSITHGWEGQQAWKKYFEPLKAANFGISGDQTGHVLWRITEGGELNGINPKVVVLMIGTNNSSRDSEKEIATGIALIVKTLQMKLPATKVLLLGIFPRGEKADTGLRKKLAGVDRIIAALDDNGKTVKYLDIGSRFLEKDGSLSRDIMPDFLHLSPRGYEIWAEAIIPTLREMLGLAGAEKVAKDNVPPPGFTALFNGKDLTGWQELIELPAREKMSPAERAKAQKAANDKYLPHWTVKDGVLHYDGKGQSLQTATDYGDIEVYVDWKIEKKGDSGIYLRGNPQVQIWDNPIGSGGLFNNQKNPSNPLVVADRPVGEWNTFHIIMKGDWVTVFLNGKKVVDNTPLENYWKRGQPLPGRGPIELQHHGDRLWFKNIYIKELNTKD